MKEKPTPSLVVVTGASQGIGAQIARDLDLAGHQVMLCGRNASNMKKRAQELLNPSFTQVCDFMNPHSIQELAAQVEEICQKNKLVLKALVHNAGVFIPAAFEESTPEDWARQFQVNFFAPLQLTKELAPLIKSSSSVIVNISSTLGKKPIPNTALYSASKAAMNSWSQSLALEWAKDGVRVAGICPGIVDTPIHSFFSEPETHSSRIQAHKAQPLGRMGKPEDISNLVQYLISDQASWVTGSLWDVDGGISLL